MRVSHKPGHKGGGRSVSRARATEHDRTLVEREARDDASPPAVIDFTLKAAAYERATFPLPAGESRHVIGFRAKLVKGAGFIRMNLGEDLLLAASAQVLTSGLRVDLSRCRIGEDGAPLSVELFPDDPDDKSTRVSCSLYTRPA